MAIDWSEAPEGAVIHVSGITPNWWRPTSNGQFEYYNSMCEWSGTSMNPYRDYPNDTVTLRQAEPKPYTRYEALRFLAERLDNWPTDIADAPLCPGWGWAAHPAHKDLVIFHNGSIAGGISRDVWERNSLMRKGILNALEFFVSVEDAQPVAGQKFDTGKPIIGAIPPHAELAVARVMTFGAQKYARDNWRKIDDIPTRYMDAALRHLNAVRRGETVDPESGEHHLAHAACCILFMLDVEATK